MTPRERLTAVLKRQVPDTVPIFVRGVSPFGERMNWMGKHDPSYERLRSFVLANTDILYGIGLESGVFLSAAAQDKRTVIREDDEWKDIESLIETPRGPIRSVTRVSKRDYFDDQIEYYIKDAEDFERFMSIPYVPVRPEVKETIRAKDREVGEHGLVAVGIPSVVGCAHALFGSEGLAMWSVLERDRLNALFTMLQRRTLEWVELILKEGAGPVLTYGGPELAVPPLMSPRDFHDFVTIIDRPINDLVHKHGRWTCIHCHGKLDKVLEEFIEIGVDILEPVEAPPGGNVALADVKRRIGDKVILMGNMPYEAIISWPPDRIETRVKADCEAAMAGGSYIMMPAASPFERVLTDKGFEGYKTYVLSGRKYGRYPQ